MNVYDFLFSDLDAATYKLINNMFGEDECEISMRKVQVQAGITDCGGVFAIAFIASVVHGQDPCDVLYQQENMYMRHHLIDCFEKLIITPFLKQCH